MAKTGMTENRERRYIRINDEALWKMIDELAELDNRYAKNFNRLVNEALSYGLPILLKIAKGDIELPEKVQTGLELAVSGGEATERMILSEEIKLLKQINVELLLNNSMTASLFNAKAMELNGRTAAGEKFKNGLYGDTPECWEQEEINNLREINEEEDE